MKEFFLGILERLIADFFLYCFWSLIMPTLLSFWLKIKEVQLWYLPFIIWAVLVILLMILYRYNKKLRPMITGEGHIVLTAMAARGTGTIGRRTFFTKSNIIWGILTLTLCGVIVILSFYGLKSSKLEQQLAIAAPEYYLIGKDGSIIYHSGANKYGLFVKREDNKIEKEGAQENVITYLLTFKKSPSHIPDVTTQEGAIPNVKQVDVNLYEAQFLINVGAYFGSPRTIECNFKVTID